MKTAFLDFVGGASTNSPLNSIAALDWGCPKHGNHEGSSERSVPTGGSSTPDLGSCVGQCSFGLRSSDLWPFLCGDGRYGRVVGRQSGGELLSIG
jgi:hypothetical protein